MGYCTVIWIQVGIRQCQHNCEEVQVRFSCQPEDWKSCQNFANNISILLHYTFFVTISRFVAMCIHLNRNHIENCKHSLKFCSLFIFYRLNLFAKTLFTDLNQRWAASVVWVEPASVTFIKTCYAKLEWLSYSTVAYISLICRVHVILI